MGPEGSAVGREDFTVLSFSFLSFSASTVGMSPAYPDLGSEPLDVVQSSCSNTDLSSVFLHS